jgi:predicted S18 family serine protease
LTSPGHAVSRDSDRGWIATLRGAGPHKGPVEVPIALWKKEQKEGILGTLQLEVVPGSGEAYLHPKDALATIIDQDFKGAMRDAWAAACERVRADGADVEGLAGRFRVVRNGTPIPDVEGNSAAGAAALGWFLALRNMVPDEGIIIMTNVVHVGIGYKPSGVGGIKEKVRAIASDGRFDTIVVGSGENQDEAEKNLAGNDHIRVLLATEL